MNHDISIVAFHFSLYSVVIPGFKADSTSSFKADSSSGNQHADYVKTKIHEAMATSSAHAGNEVGVTSSRATPDVTSSRPAVDRPEGSAHWPRSHLHPMDASSVRGIPIIPGIPDSSGSSRGTVPDSSANNRVHPLSQEPRTHQQLPVNQTGQNPQFNAHSPMREDMVSGSRQRSPRPSTQSQSSDDGLGAGSTVSSADDAMNASSSTQIHRIPGGRGSPAMVVQDAYGRTRSPRPSYPSMMAESSTPGPGQQAARRSPKITPGPGDMCGSDNDPRPSSREAQANYHPHPLHSQSPHARPHSHSPRASVEGSPGMVSQGHERVDVDENSADSSASRRTGSEGSRPGSRSGPGYSASGQDILSVTAQDADSRSQHGRSPQPGRSPHHHDSGSTSGHHTADSSRSYMGASHYSPVSSHGRSDVSTSRSESGTTSCNSSVVPPHGFNHGYMYPGGNVQRHNSASNTSPQEASPAPLLNPQYETLSDDES